MNGWNGYTEHGLESRKDANAIYEAISPRDVQSASDESRSVYEKTQGRDGLVSLEINPHLARDTKGTVQDAPRL